MNPIRCAVIGVGYLGRFHAQKIQMLEKAKLVAVCDVDASACQAAAKEFNVPAYQDYHQLLKDVEAVCIAATTSAHYDIAKTCLTQGIHVLIEKPMTETVAEAEALIALAKKHKAKLQVGHLERFNAARLALDEHLEKPLFIESNRLAPFNPRGTDVNVVLDLMIHDIDIILSVVNSPIKKIDASGVAVISETPDISNARIEFENGCVANLTASRISLKKMRKTRFFQKNAYIAVDFLTKKVEVVKIKDAPEITDDLALLLTNAEGEKKQIYFENPEIHDSNAIQEELEHFADCIHNNNTPLVSLKDGAKALAVAHQIIACIG